MEFVEQIYLDSINNSGFLSLFKDGWLLPDYYVVKSESTYVDKACVKTKGEFIRKEYWDRIKLNASFCRVIKKQGFPRSVVDKFEDESLKKVLECLSCTLLNSSVIENLNTICLSYSQNIQSLGHFYYKGGYCWGESAFVTSSEVTIQCIEKNSLPKRIIFIDYPDIKRIFRYYWGLLLLMHFKTNEFMTFSQRWLGPPQPKVEYGIWGPIDGAMKQIEIHHEGYKAFLQKNNLLY